MSLQERIYLTAKDNIGETSWAFNKDRRAKRNSLVHFKCNEWKCNLFVYEVLYAAGCDIGTPNRYPNYDENTFSGIGSLIYFPFYDNHRPPCCIDWYDKKVSACKYIGEGEIGKNKCKQGDIITDGSHIGIVDSYDPNTKDGKSINAAKEKVLCDGFGFGSGKIKEVRTVRIFRAI